MAIKQDLGECSKWWYFQRAYFNLIFVCFSTVQGLAGLLSVLWECCRTMLAFCPIQFQASYHQDLSLRQVIKSTRWSALSLHTVQHLKWTNIDLTALSFRAFQALLEVTLLNFFDYSWKQFCYSSDSNQMDMT